MPTDGLFGSYYSQAISKFAPHPAAARLWEEFLYSDEGQNIWLKGLSRPVRLDADDRRPAPPTRRRSRRCRRWTATVEFPDDDAADRRAEGRRGPLERGDVRLSTGTAAPAAPARSPQGPARPRAARCSAPLPFFLYVAVFLLLPIVVLAVEAFRATDPVTFEETWSTDSHRRHHRGPLPPGLPGQPAAVADHRGASAPSSAWRSPWRSCGPAAACCCAGWCSPPPACWPTSAASRWPSPSSPRSATPGVITALLTDTLGHRAGRLLACTR